MNKISIVLLVVLCFSCNERTSFFAETKKTFGTTIETDDAIEKNYDAKIKYIQTFAKNNDKNENVAFMIDFSLHSGKNRFFVVDLKKVSIVKEALVCHGSCKDVAKNGERATNFSNTNESLCTSLGMAVIGERAYSKWCKNYKYWLDGLETSNSNMRKRVVVLHAWKHVPDIEIYPSSIVMSWGCPTVSIKFLDELDVILKKNKKVLLYAFN